MNSLDHLEAELLVDFRIGGIAALEVAQPVFQIALYVFETIRAWFQDPLRRNGLLLSLTCRVTASINLRA